jgi:2-polyprenyl-3-methyl-5-hydroxy-6-metoxy-1,4-benzoquinol methylase
MSTHKVYREKQYEILTDGVESFGIAAFGPMSSLTWNSDPKRLSFVLSRYKFAARMLESSRHVIEVGCGDGFAARIVRQHVDNLTLSDFDPLMIEHAMTIQSKNFPVDFLVHDFAKTPFIGTDGPLFDGAYLIDVLEHIPISVEASFLRNLVNSIEPGGRVVIGMPSLESQVYASQGSKDGHVNCKTKEQLIQSLRPHFASVVSFAMNDEVLHTGFARMANYLFAVCTVK